MKRILVSACLLGTGCRYDGKNKGNEAVLQLLRREDLQLIPVCPEQLGGLPTPRAPSERRGERVVNCAGDDVTAQFRKGALEALRFAERFGCRCAILKERSPSCGSGQIYDGTFTGTLTDGSGVTAELLKQNGITVVGESRLLTALEE
ncbi:MAG: DUF523 domain-containing protein [Faecousia sp.]